MALISVLPIFCLVCLLHLSATEFANKLDGRPCEMELTTVIINPVFFANGSIMDLSTRVVYPRGTYWKWDDSTVDMVYVGCPCKLGRPCLKKCCPKGQVFEDGRGCVLDGRQDGGASFRVKVANDDGSQEYVVVDERFHILNGNSCYYGHYRLRPELFDDNEYYLWSSNGSLALPKADIDSLWTDEFCLEYSAEIGEERPFLCLPVFRTLKRQVPSLHSPTFMWSSAPVALFTFLAYLFLPEARPDFNAKLRMFYIYALMQATFFSACLMRYAQELDKQDVLILGVASQFFNLSSTCWIAIMLCCSTYSAAPSWLKSEGKRWTLLWKVAFPWVFPALITLLAATTAKRTDNLPQNEISPGYTEARLWIGDFQRYFLWFSCADVLVLLMTMALVLVTLLRVCRYGDEEAVLGDAAPHTLHSRNKKRPHSHKKWFCIISEMAAANAFSRFVEVSCWMSDVPETRLLLVDVADSVYQVSVCLVLIYADRILLLLLARFRQMRKTQRPPGVLGANISTTKGKEALIHHRPLETTTTWQLHKLNVSDLIISEIKSGRTPQCEIER